MCFQILVCGIARASWRNLLWPTGNSGQPWRANWSLLPDTWFYLGERYVQLPVDICAMSSRYWSNRFVMNGTFVATLQALAAQCPKFIFTMTSRSLYCELPKQASLWCVYFRLIHFSYNPPIAFIIQCLFQPKLADYCCLLSSSLCILSKQSHLAISYF